MIRKLNQQQRCIDDSIERLGSADAQPFICTYAEELEWEKVSWRKLLSKLLKKSGDELIKPSVPVLSPTASAAKLIKGQTI